MLEIHDALLLKGREHILCTYSNPTEHPQIVRIPDNSSWYERVVFPGDWLLFYTLPETCLEIHSPVTPSTTLADKISCSKLAIGFAPPVAQRIRSIRNPQSF